MTSQETPIPAVLLKVSESSPLQKDRCIVCQKEKSTKLTSTESGQKQVREAAALRKDDVFNRLKLIPKTEKFYYHVDNNCYKSYTLKKTLDQIRSTTDDCNNSGEEESGTSDPNSPLTKRIRRSSSTARPSPSEATLSNQELPCIVCGSVTTTEKGTKVRKKFRICEERRANNFLAAAVYYKDTVFERIADLDSDQKIFAADIFAHGRCIKAYIAKYQREILKHGHQRTPSKKFELFKRAKDILDPLLEAGYGFTLTDIKELMVSFDEEVNLYNNEIKGFLVKTYQEKITFCESKRKNEPMLVFSSQLSTEQLAAKIRSHDAVKEAGNIIRQAMQNIDFGLQDKFCDATELRLSWEKTKMPDVLLTFFSSLFKINKSHLLHIDQKDIEKDDEDDTDCDDKATQKQNSVQLHSLFQIIYYEMFHGQRKTPLHMMTAHSIYDKCKSKELITSFNRLGLSTSYTDLARSRNLLSSYAIKSCERTYTPIPSHFSSSGFTVGAFDNFDFEDSSSLSGKNSTHDTAMVLFQDISSTPVGKPDVSTTGLERRSCKLKSHLPCQDLKFHPKPVTRPALPYDFKVAEDDGLPLSDKALQSAENREFFITFVRCGQPDKASDLPCWGAFHALISQSHIPLKKTGFLPVIPHPVTNYATVYTAMRNFQSVREQLTQPVLPIVCDEGVFHIVVDITLNNPDDFGDLYPMMGMFHMTKVALRCAGRYITGSGIDDALIECDIFGIKTLDSVLKGKHYVRAFHGMLIVSEVIESLIWKAFWKCTERNDYGELLSGVTNLAEALKAKNSAESSQHFQDVMEQGTVLHQSYLEFKKSASARSELCQYLCNFLEMVGLIKNLVASDRDGNWHLHIQTVESLMKLFREFDCVNYLRYGSWYIEKVKRLELDCPYLYQKFCDGNFVVKEKDGKFNAVAPDMKLEQTIQRSQKSSKGIIGQTRRSEYVTEWQLIYHEVLNITNTFRELTNTKVLEHMETYHHKLTGKKSEVFNQNVTQLLQFLDTKGNPFNITQNFDLHNLVTMRSVDECVKERLLNVMNHGKDAYTSFRQERFIAKEKKLGDRISRVNLPNFNFSKESSKQTSTVSVTTKELGLAQNRLEIARQRGETMKDILSHDLLHTSPLFDGEAPKKTVKHKLTVELEKHLSTEDCLFEPVSNSKTTVLVDFMSQIRMVKMTTHNTFGQIIKTIFRKAQSVCSTQEIHIILDSYLDKSTKESERIRRASSSGSIDLISISSETPVPVQLEKFWASSTNKQNLQKLVSTEAKIYSSQTIMPLVVSGVILNGEVLPAQMFTNGEEQSVMELKNSIEEADYRLVPHVEWAAQQNTKRVVLLSNDTDVIAIMLRYIERFKSNGLSELWIQFGTGEKQRFLPLHTLQKRLGPDLSRVLVKAHLASGNDALSKIGTKHGALAADPVTFLTNFGETDNLSDTDVQNLEKYLVMVWSPKAQVDTFDELRYEDFHKNLNKSLATLPPTSSVIEGHIRRTFLAVREAITLLDQRVPLEPTDYGWEESDGILLPSKHLKPLPDVLLTVCNCKNCKTKRCKCRKANLNCCAYCKCSTSCDNS